MKLETLYQLHHRMAEQRTDKRDTAMKTLLVTEASVSTIQYPHTSYVYVTTDRNRQ